MNTKKALVIDDEQIVLDSIEKILKDKGVDVYATLSAGGGISHAISEQFDIVLTDIRMPGIDGFKVVRDIRRFNPSVPILIITGFANIQSAVQAIKLGANHFIEKPFTPEQLTGAVDLAIENAAGVEPWEQTLIHPKEMLKVLKKGAADPDFAHRVFDLGSKALDSYKLTAQEKLAIITADTAWIEDQMGILKPKHKEWLERSNE